VSLRERIAEREASLAERAELLRKKLADVEHEPGPPSAWAADSTTSASDEPTPEPTSSCSSPTWTSASSPPPPENSSAS
jgi:hypothetical protein